MVKPMPEVPEPVPIPSSPSGTTRKQSSTCSSPQSSSFYPDKEDTKSTSSDDSITSPTSGRQLRPLIPINYNETLLKHLHCKQTR